MFSINRVLILMSFADPALADGSDLFAMNSLIDTWRLLVAVGGEGKAIMDR